MIERIAGSAKLRRMPELRQVEAAECGLACLAMVLHFHGRPLDLAALRRQHPVSMKGMTLKSLMETAQRLGLGARPLRLDLDHLFKLHMPCILHWDMNHFVVLAARGRHSVTIHDPATGVRRASMAEVSRHFTGVALELKPESGFSLPAPTPRFSLREAIGKVTGLGSALAQGLILSVFLQAYVLASPLFMQLVVDEAISKDDADLVVVLALGFGLCLAINCGATLLRARLMAHVTAAIGYQMGARLFRHLLRLPMSYFEKRHVGELVSRFGSIDPIRRLLVEGVITALIDGSMAVLTAVTIFVLSPRLGAIVLMAFLAYLGLHAVSYHTLRRLVLNHVVAKARENATFLETVRAIQSIRIFGRETERGAIWLNRYAELVQADTALSTVRAYYSAINDLFFGIENITVIAIGAHIVLTNHMTVGMLFAFVVYKQQFVSKSSRLVDQFIEFRMLDLHLDRLSDIAHAEGESTCGRAAHDHRQVRGRIEVRNLSYRYGPSEPYVFENVSFVIEIGDHVAITGPSGGGKTTLLKVILGLLPPTKGEILIDDVPLSTIGAGTFRACIGVVMQDDHLMSGSIADNICFFDEQSDLDHMVHCARLACVDEDIINMPMGYNSLIGDMGTSLSGGQRQRLLLARALYRRPRMLFVDEGTSNLDIVTEQRVTQAISTLPLTRVVIAHRPETIWAASRIFAIDLTGLREVEMDPSRQFPAHEAT